MSTNVYDLANELDRAIRKLPEYQAVKAVKEKIEADKAAKVILDEYVALQSELHQLLQSGQLLTEDLQKKMEKVGQKVQENTLLNDYFTKQQQLSVYIGDIEKIIFKPLQDLL